MQAATSGVQSPRWAAHRCQPACHILDHLPLQSVQRTTGQKHWFTPLWLTQTEPSEVEHTLIQPYPSCSGPLPSCPSSR
eukprot:6492715-Amphidinium_carterae.2